MHPLVKVLVLMTLCQVLTVAYLSWHHRGHNVWWAPLGICVGLLVFLVLRLAFNLNFPFFV